jgi:hypothetical protein
MKRNENLEKLIGMWVTDNTDTEAFKEYGKTTLEFGSDGQLTYTIHTPEKEQKIFCIFKVVGSYILSNQPSHPQEEKTRFHFRNDGRLVLDFEGLQTVYVRKNTEVTF